ncbi:hypothetical protein GCM10023264_12110 [Sphingomonas daechungensis]|uniref:Transposase n=1 Tax=Sphingomonas daechungensis TaxID=1176646 RepID=A0ABX6SXP9_9SPHN|nr:hypothetical protein [Sphingomonas daechungensis]QNP42367.1 hypothetical protein H9L15_08535 [Sphingomonas daechungensis]
MSRAVFLDMSEKAIIAHCKAEQIGISCIGPAASGGTRLVCMSVYGASQIRRQLGAKLTKGAPEQHGPGWGYVPRP